MVFTPLALNDKSNIPTFDVDPDIHFYNDLSLCNIGNSNYFFDDEFRDHLKNVSKNSITLSLFHTNIRSLPAHHMDLVSYLCTLPITLSIIAVSETWLTGRNVDLYGIQGYSHIQNYRTCQRGGGVSLFL